MKPLLLASLGTLFGLAATPATPPVPPVERIEIRLAQFDVVVRDKKGAIVTGIQAPAFSVFEDGSPLEVVAVDEWGSGRAATGSSPGEPPSPLPAAPGATSAPEPPPPGPERRSFIFVFDALGDSTALRMSQAKRAAGNFARAHLHPEDLSAVYQLDLALRPMSGVTSNVDELTRAFEKVSWMPASSLQDEIAESVLSYGSTGGTPLMQQRLTGLSISAAQQLDWEREHVYDSLNSLASVFRGMPGRRVLVLVSPGFPLTTPGDKRNGAGGFTPRFRELIRSMAAYGVTVYSLDIGNDLAAGDVTETIDWRVAVGKLGMDENILSDLGLERALGTGSAVARREFLGVIAAETGGRLLTQTDLSKAFDAIEEESTRFYRISCRVPVTRTSDRYRKLVVKVNNPGFVVTTRRGRYSDITPLEPAAPERRASVESLDRYRPLTARGIAFPLPGTDPKKVPVEVVVEALGPIQLPTDAQGAAGLDVEFRLVARAEGEIVDRYERSFTARVKPEGVAAIRKGFRVEGRLALVPGIYEIQSSVRLGDPPQLATWISTVAVAPTPKGPAPAFAGALLSADSETDSPLLTSPPPTETGDPLTLRAGVRVLPATHTDFEAGRGLLVLFWLRGFSDAGEKPPELNLAVEITDPQGKTVTLPTKLLFFGPAQGGGYRVLARIDAASLKPGTYALKLAAGVEGQPEQTARHTVSFALHTPDVAAAVTSSSAPTP